MVVSVRSACCSLKYCFTCDDLYSTWRLGSTPSGMTRGRSQNAGGGGGGGDAQGKQQAHAVRSSEVEILADHRFEEMTALHGAIEDLGQTDFELTEGQAVVVSGHAFRGGHRPRQAVRPPVEEGLDIGRTERITRGLEPGRVST